MGEFPHIATLGSELEDESDVSQSQYLLNLLMMVVIIKIFTMD
jgi:hypothetical protein